jgi:hypothetical protein
MPEPTASIYLQACMISLLCNRIFFSNCGSNQRAPESDITLNFIMLPVSNQDEQIEVVATSLNGNIPILQPQYNHYV